jgi:2-methylisocitrate lyase-like PEP mutase family enzyme
MRISMTTAVQKRQALRNLLNRPGIIVAPGTGDALGARLIEEAGFEVCYMSGYAVEATYGKPDVGLMTLLEMANRAAEICDVTSLPLVSDADTGYGNVVNVTRMARDFERAGVAAVQMEDQTLPKKCGSMSGRGVISTAEMIGKIKAFVDARTDPNFLMIARTDVCASEGIAAASDRLAAYKEAGADMVMALGPYTIEEVEYFVKRATAPVAYLNSESFTMPMTPADQLEAMGVKMVIAPLALTMAKVHAMRETLQVLKTNQADTREFAKTRMCTWADCNRLTGFDDIKRIETEFASNI